MSSLLIDQELDGTRVRVPDRLSDRRRVLEQPVQCLLGTKRRRRDLHHFLVSSLDGTVPLEQVDDVSVVVSDDLNFDMLRVIQES